LEKYQHDVAKTPQYEREIKEKNLLIGKLRHEGKILVNERYATMSSLSVILTIAIILNEHLVEAMRRLKEESNENNVDRQLVTNLVVGFFLAPRGDRKRYDILTIIANVLQMNEEQKEQVGLIRMKGNGNGQRTNASPNSSGWQSPRQQQENEPKEVKKRKASHSIFIWSHHLLTEWSFYIVFYGCMDLVFAEGIQQKEAKLLVFSRLFP
jgi:hypothetical protein